MAAITAVNLKGTSLISTASLHRELLVIRSELRDSSSLVHAIPYSINLIVSVDEFDKICSFVNIIFAVSLCFNKAYFNI